MCGSESLDGSWGLDGEGASGDGVVDVDSGAAWAEPGSRVGRAEASSGGVSEMGVSGVGALAGEKIGCTVCSMGEGNIDVPSVLGEGGIEGPGWSRGLVPVMKVGL